MAELLQGSNPLVTVLVVNWQGEAVIEECLGSLVRQAYSPLEILVVDNGSTDRSISMIRERFGDRVSLIENPTNLGFAAGNNVGLRVAKGKYVALLNNDAVADPLWVGEMVKRAEADPTIGMCASKIYSYDEPGILDSAGGLLIYPDGLSRGRGRLEEDRGQYDDAEETLMPSACACLYRREMFDAVGFFDEDFFAYSEDADLGLRGRLAGWRCVFVPRATVRHRYSASAGRYSPLKAFLAERNRIWVGVKNLPLSVLTLGPIYTFWRLLLHAYAVVAGRGASGKYAERYPAGSLVLIALKAYLSAMAGLPKMWGKRRKIQRSRKVSSGEIRRWLKRYRIGARELAFKE
jgi:GT2 family glycosyltransferase